MKRYGNWVVTDDSKSVYDNKLVYIKTLMGLSTDVDTLPKKSTLEGFDLGTGSVAQCLDTGDIYIYYDVTDTWYKQ